MSFQKRKNQQPRIPAGSIELDRYLTIFNLSNIIEQLTNKYNFTEEDLKKAFLDTEKDYSNCYYEGDHPDVIVIKYIKWDNIY